MKSKLMHQRQMRQRRQRQLKLSKRRPLSKPMDNRLKVVSESARERRRQTLLANKKEEKNKKDAKDDKDDRLETNQYRPSMNRSLEDIGSFDLGSITALKKDLRYKNFRPSSFSTGANTLTIRT